MQYLFVTICAFVLTSCSATFLKHDKESQVVDMNEFDRAIKVSELPAATPTPVPVPGKKGAVEAPSAQQQQAKAEKKRKKAVGPVAPLTRQPDLEDKEGFTGASRRPDQDPFRVGEKTTLMLTYFGISAGDMTLEVRPFIQVNGRKAYHYASVVKSSSMFASIYSVDDWSETFVDYETLLPYSYSIHVKESKQLREIRNLFDWEKMLSTVWDKRVTKENGLEDKKTEWQILPFTQNVISSAFYVRNFKMIPGKTIQFRLADESKNILLKGEIIRKEKLSTDLGEFDTVVMKPTIEIDNVFKPMGDVYFWFTDDDRRFVVKIESKIKIGKIIGYVKSLEKGQP